MGGSWNDLRVALRALLRSPGFTAVSVVTLALGIGANTAIFTLVEGVLLRPLPFPEPDRLVRVAHSARGQDGVDRLAVSEGLYVAYRDRARTVSPLAIHMGAVVSLIAEGEPERIEGERVTPSFFDVLRVPPALGRPLVAVDGRPGAEPVVVLSDGLWRRRFGGEPAILGRTVLLSGVERRVVGVMPADFRYPDPDDQLWIPIELDDARAVRGNFSYSGIGRLAPGATVEAAAAELQGILPDVLPEFVEQAAVRAGVRPLKEAVVGEVSRTLQVLLGTVGVVLLIACGNVANLFLVRAEGRQREMALRTAIGAGRIAVVRTFLAESLVLAAAAGALGIGIAGGAIRALSALAPAEIPRMEEVHIDGAVVAFTAGLSLASALLFGLWPSLRQARGDLSESLRDGGSRGATGGREALRTRNALVVVQVALALVLLVGSGLMLRSFLALRAVQLGFDPDGVLTVRLIVPEGQVPDPVEAAAFYRALLERLRAQPGVLAAGAVDALPLSGRHSFGSLEIEDHPRSPSDLPLLAARRVAEPGYFGTMGIPLLQGREFQPGDAADGVRAAVVSASFAERWWPGGSPLGRRLRLDSEEEWYEIVGVVGNAHYVSLGEEAEEMVYVPTVQGPAAAPSPSRSLDVVVRVEGEPVAALPVLRREVRALDPRVPLANVRPMAELVRASTARTSFTALLLGTASAMALALGMVGIYGVVSYVVSRRTREIGVRMALGASRPVVGRMVVLQGMRPILLGVVLGLAVAVALSRVLASLLFGVTATDPVTYAAVAAALTAVSLLASWLPARRAAGVDPLVALRSE